jgi:hypothetical protein
MELGVDVLADVLLMLANQSIEVNDRIERLVTPPSEFVQQFKMQLSQLKSSKRYFDWRASSNFAFELDMMLQDIKLKVHDPLIGAKLVAAFYEADEFIFEMCDDSGGEVGDVFRYHALELFADYANRCVDKNKIINIIIELTQKDDYTVRSGLIDDAAQYFSKELVSNLIENFQKLVSNEKNEYKRQHHVLIESLARQVKDAKLFEKTRILLSQELSTASMIDIAQVYLASGDTEVAYSWLKKVPKVESSYQYKMDELLIETYTKLGESEKLHQLLYKKFREYHSIKSLDALLDQIGHDKRDEVVSGEVAQILKSAYLHSFDVEFLIKTGKIDEAEQYLLTRADQLDGGYYGNLLSVVDVMESESRYLMVCLIYRSLLIPILERAKTKTYPQGIVYLKQLDNLSAKVDDWRNFNDHITFKEWLYHNHHLKYSFWRKYDDQYKPSKKK